MLVLNHHVHQLRLPVMTDGLLISSPGSAIRLATWGIETYAVHRIRFTPFDLIVTYDYPITMYDNNTLLDMCNHNAPRLLKVVAALLDKGADPKAQSKSTTA